MPTQYFTYSHFIIDSFHAELLCMKYRENSHRKNMYILLLLLSVIHAISKYRGLINYVTEQYWLNYCSSRIYIFRSPYSKSLASCPGYLSATVDPNLEAKRGRGSTRDQRHQRDATGVTRFVSHASRTLPTLCPAPSVRTATVKKQHRHGKWRVRETPACKHQIRPGNVSRAG